MGFAGAAHLKLWTSLIAQLGEHCTGIAEVVGSNPAQSLKIFFQVSVQVVLRPHLLNDRSC